ncbi:flagellar protein export ATPase FliI [Antarcticirhabdus aurantiaca]|uniref:Flagellar protein export ATPase FliI n=1 Tax=Antarcticirhabdus aurantiaca TaxID=2606717 RepID=A0ACD4NU92_9HYPH|nr:flagellar protein export ATPase FliI [Antarcticirhabdus aurantiaca]WAJ30296.1 flagellar protein export ATPase FliI [Jeongeuplla avenae]
MTATATEARLSALAALDAPRLAISGRVVDVAPTSWRVGGLSPFVRLGDCIACEGPDGEELGEVVRVENDAATVKPFGVGVGAQVGSFARRIGPMTIAPHAAWKGRVVDAFGRPCDGKGPIEQGAQRFAPEDGEPPRALDRARTGRPVKTNVMLIDVFTPLVLGQRIGIFAGSGVGKSTLMGMLARADGFDSVVVALVGERGREVREFVEDTLGDTLGKVVAVVATGDESPMMRRLAPKTAMAIAECFRDQGENVLLIVDSVTRLAHAARDVALAAGEPPVSRGYPPSVFSELPMLLERAGPGREGSGTITGIFTVLVDGDDHNDPIADSIRGTLDGHIVLDRAIAEQGRFPAMDVLKSISRLAPHAWQGSERELVTRLRSMIARFEDTRDLRLLGGYQRGSDQTLDIAVDLVPILYDILIQKPEDPQVRAPFDEISRRLKEGMAPKG